MILVNSLAVTLFAILVGCSILKWRLPKESPQVSIEISSGDKHTFGSQILRTYHDM